MFILHAGPNRVCKTNRTTTPVIVAIPENVDFTKAYTSKQSVAICRARGMELLRQSSDSHDIECTGALMREIQSTFGVKVWNVQGTGTERNGMICVRKPWSK